ncbi:MAG: sensor histidine kinase [Planctomycetota bacterium]|jgi:signal transduction histidine kinase
MTLPAGTSERRLCAILGHELRNPLASAMVSMSVVEEMTAEGDPRGVFLQRARADLERLSGLLNSYLDYGRAAETCRREALDLCELLSQRCASQEGSSPRMNLPTEPIRIEADAGLLGRAIDNVLENAFAMGAERVEVDLSEDGGRAVLRIRDDGPGVPAQLREDLFKPFVSGRSSSGLGLALSRELLAAHGGSIELEASVIGACFKITLPIHAERVAGLVGSASI